MGEAARRYLDAAITEHGEAAVWARLRDSRDHDLRRAAFRYSFDARLLGLEDVVTLFPGERDQVVRRMLTRVIAETAPAEVIAGVLLRGRSAESRALGLVKLTAAELDPADVQRLLADRSVLVRLWARRRWQEMGRDPASTCASIARSGARPIVRARAFTGLAEIGTVIAREEIIGLVRSEELPLRKVGLALLRESATSGDVPVLLPLVAGDDSRVARLASEVLAHNPHLWAPSDLDSIGGAQQPELRRRAWWLRRSRGGWEAVIADLELLGDPDPRLAGFGRQPEPPMYLQPTDAQRRRIADLLGRAPLGRGQLLSIALAAGLSDLVRALRTRPAIPPPPSGSAAAPREPWWRVWNRHPRR